MFLTVYIITSYQRDSPTSLTPTTDHIQAFSEEEAQKIWKQYILDSHIDLGENQRHPFEECLEYYGKNITKLKVINPDFIHRGRVLSTSTEGG